MGMRGRQVMVVSTVATCYVSELTQRVVRSVVTFSERDLMLEKLHIMILIFGFSDFFFNTFKHSPNMEVAIEQIFKVHKIIRT